MRPRSRFGRWCFPILFAGLAAASSLAAQALHPTEPEVAFQPDRNSAVHLDRILLLLAPNAAQRKSLDDLLAAQIEPGNPLFHRWLTPAQFAARFAAGADQAARVAGWLEAQGFKVAPLPASRGWIEFSGTALQVQQAFGARLEAIPGSLETRYRLASAPQMPAAIAASVQGLVSLDGALSAPATTAPAELNLSAEALASRTNPSQSPALTPALVQNWLHLPAQTAASGLPTGAGESIAILARSDVRPQDFAAFRQAFGLPEAPLAVASAGSAVGRNADEPAAIQAASWAGVAAPEAQIVLVPAASTNATDGLDLALAAAIDGALAHTVALGFRVCEASLSPAHQAFYAALYRQAAAQGMAIVAATGDSGAAACHTPGDPRPVATGFGVNALASTPWNTAVGAVGFEADTSALAAWSAAPPAQTAYATGGGASSLYATPAWQSAAGLPASDPVSESSSESGSEFSSPAAHHRYLPDVSLPTASAASPGLAFCYSGESEAPNCRLVAAGGSSAAAALFSGIAARIAQQNGAQGNLAPRLYALAARQATASAFPDVTSGNSRLPCLAGTPNCPASGADSGQIGFSATAGYDLASGLGSVDAEALLKNWAAPQAVGTAPVTVEMTTIGGITYNPSATITLSAKVLSGSGSTVPTGTIQFYDQTTNANTGTPVTLTATGTASYQESGQFTDGGHNIVAEYSGDATYEAAVSQPITLNIQPSPTALVVRPSTLTPAGGSTIAVTGVVTSSNPGSSPPSGTLTVNLDGLPQGTATLATAAGITSGSVSVTVPTAGSHTVQGAYSGDTNYSSSTSPSVAIVVSKVATVTTIAATPSTLTTGVPETFTATVAPATAAAGVTYILTGTVSFYDTGTTLLGTVPVSSNTALLTGIALSATATHIVTAVYSGDATYSASSSSPLLLASTLLPVTVTLTESSPVIGPDQPVTLTATVTPVNTPPLTAEQHPSGYLLFYANNGAASTLISGQVSIVPSTGYSSVGSTIVPHLAAGQYTVSAQYFGDTTYGPAISNSLALNAEDFTVACYRTQGDGTTTTNLSVQQGGTVTASCVVVSLGGLTGPIQLACAEQNPPQIGPIACTFPPPGTVSSSGTLTVTIATTAGNLSQNNAPVSPAWPAGAGGIALAFAGLLLSPIGRRARFFRNSAGRFVALALLLAGIAGAGLGCGNTVVPTNNGGTPLGVHTLKITAGALVDTVTVTHDTYLTVDVTP